MNVTILPRIVGPGAVGTEAPGALRPEDPSLPHRGWGRRAPIPGCPFDLQRVVTSKDARVGPMGVRSPGMTASGSRVGAVVRSEDERIDPFVLVDHRCEREHAR